MIHHHLENDEGHYAVGISTPYKGVKKYHKGGILLQIADYHDQTRIKLSIDEANHIIELLKESIKEYQESID